jgi:preprotein translocase subunit SecA
VSRQVEKAQRKVEEYHYGVRKNLLEYDQVANSQRTLIYRQRQAIIEGKDCDKTLIGLYRESVDTLIQSSAADGTRGEELAKRISETFAKDYGLPAPDAASIPVKDGGDACMNVLMPIIEQGVEARKKELGDIFDHLLRFVMLETIDRRWKDHLYGMDHLRHAIGLEGYAQKDPRLRYKEEGYRLFATMNQLIQQDIAKLFFRLQVQQPPGGEAETIPAHLEAGGFKPVAAAKTMAAMAGSGTASNDREASRPKPGANDPCPCGSGLPFKRCHGN